MKWSVLFFVLCSCGQRQEAQIAHPVVEPLPASTDSTISDDVGASDAALIWRSWPEWVSDRTHLDRPVLFYIAAPGCEGLFVQPSALLRELVEERYIGVKVDPFAWPDAVRYLRPGGCPSLVVASSEGQIVARATDIPPRHVESYILRILGAFEKGLVALGRADAPQMDARRIRPEQVHQVLRSAYDERHGGLFGPQKFLHARALRFLWQRAADVGDASPRRAVEHSVAAFLGSPLRDDNGGGFALYAHTPDWSQPAAERDGLYQAEAVQLLLDVGEYDAVLSWLDYVDRQLRDRSTGALYGRQVQRRDGRWWTDANSYVDRMAALALALVRVAEERNVDMAADTAGEAVRYVVDYCIDDRGAVRHMCAAPGPQGLLVDQAMVALMLQAWTRRSGDALAARAMERVVRFAEEHLYSPEHGLFAAGADWPVDGDFSAADDGYPVGNALMAEWYYTRGDRARADQLVDAARFLDGEYRVAAHWAWLQVVHGESERQ